MPVQARFHHTRAWSLLRNRLCALTSANGGFGFTCGVEWLAADKIRVHESTGLSWGAAENLVPELSQLNRLLAEHPCFFDGAKLTRLSIHQLKICADQVLMRRNQPELLELCREQRLVTSRGPHQQMIGADAFRILREAQAARGV